MIETKNTITFPHGKLLHGGDYNLDQWLKYPEKFLKKRVASHPLLLYNQLKCVLLYIFKFCMEDVAFSDQNPMLLICESRDFCG